MSGLNVKTDALEAGYVALSNASEEIARVLTELDDEVSTLRQRWSGAASDAYDEAQRRWSATLAEMRRLLSAHSVSLQGIDERYRQAGKKINGIWS